MTKTSLCPAVDDQGRKCRKLLPHFDYEHIFMDDPSKAGEKIPPALTPEEWTAIMEMGVDWSAYRLTRQQIAALALHGQPFGFTREDLAAIERIEDGDDAHEVMLQLLSLKERIEALLPPSDEKPRDG